MANDFSAQLRAHLNREPEKEVPQDVYGRLAQLFEKVTGLEAERETALDEVDSLDRIELAVRVEEAFGVRFDGPLPAQSVGELADYIVSRAEKA